MKRNWRLTKFMEWQNLLSDFRFGERKISPNPNRPPWQYDFDRIIFSSAFRRLQDKTQVFPLSSSDYVRTRLTHSLEVTVVGRSLGDRIGLFLHEQGVLEDAHYSKIGQIVAAATLAHDIGNPPFGHSGEDAIQSWFENSPTIKAHLSELKDTEKSDFLNYEGNAQGFRVLTRLQMHRDQGGMRLTAATLAAFTKYPVQAPHLNEPRKHKGISTKKFGFFQSEKEIFETVAEKTGLIRRRDEPNCWCRHPLAFIVEAADDISYRLVDLEDAFRLGLISYQEIEDIVTHGLVYKNYIQRIRKEPDNVVRVDMIRSISIGTAITQVVEAFKKIMTKLCLENLMSPCWLQHI